MPSGDLLPIDETPFTTTFHWNYQSVPISVVPLLHEKFPHYKVELPDGIDVVVYVNEDKNWSEIGKGPTDQSRAIGEAIDKYYF